MPCHMVLVPAVCYLALHVVGWHIPSWLWGVDQFHYFPTQYLAISVVGMIALFSATLIDLQKCDSTLEGLSRFFNRPAFHSIVPRLLLLAGFFALAYAFQVRAHYLGDSSMWFNNMEIMLLEDNPGSIAWVVGIPLEGLQHIPMHQSLDFTLHYQAYRFGKWLFGWTPADAYSWISLAAGFPYAWTVWRICKFEFSAGLLRHTAFALLLTLGNTQLFFGYGESYTLLTLVSVLYVYYGLRCVRDKISIVVPFICFSGAVALHLMALTLIPSILYLLWRTPFGSRLRQSGVYIPLIAVGVIVGFLLYWHFYRPLHMPIFSAPEDGMYAVFSVPHLLNLFNEVLLISPFGLLWGLSNIRPDVQPSNSRRFVGFAALGATVLIAVHLVPLGGRDWDIMAFPGFFYTLWGLLTLARLPQRERYFSQARLVVVPLMTLHTGLWIVINSDQQRGLERLGNLLLHTPNQSQHYRDFTLGHYYTNLREGFEEVGERYLRNALAAVPVDEKRNIEQYSRVLAIAVMNVGSKLQEEGDHAAAIERFQEAAELQPNLFLAYYKTGLSYFDLERFELSAAEFQQALGVDPDQAEAYFQLGTTYNRLRDYSEAVAAYQRGLSLVEYSGARFNLATTYLILGDTENAMAEYERLKTLDPDLAARLLEQF